jgi:cell shape-determining protein MreC
LSTYRRKSIARSKKVLVALLIVACVAAIFFPQRWTGGLISLVQVIVPFQDAATVAADAVSHLGETRPSAVPGETYEGLAREKAAVEHQAAALAARVAELEGDVRVLTATRLWEVAGRRIGASGRLIPARVIAEDILPWRSSRLLNAGSVQGVQDGVAVVSRLFTVDRRDDADLRDGLAILLGEVLVGTIEQTGTHTSRVKLLSDVSVQMKVRIGRWTGDRFTLLDRYFWLTGRGTGRMEIRDVERKDVETGVIQVGDTVLSDPQSDVLPAAMTIGKIAAASTDRDNPLFAILTIASAVPEQTLRRVYIYDPQLDAR